jgi:hypothetical protein
VASVPSLRKEKGLEIKSFKCLSVSGKNQAEIVKRFEEGHTPVEVAAMFGLTIPQVEIILEANMKLKQGKMWLEAIQRDHNAILEIPKEQWTEKLCLAAVKKSYEAIYYMSKEHLTKGICLTVHRQHPVAIRFVPKDCREIYLRYTEGDEKPCRYNDTTKIDLPAGG